MIIEAWRALFFIAKFCKCDICAGNIAALIGLLQQLVYGWDTELV